MYVVTIIAMHKQLNFNICITCYYICTNQLQYIFAILSSPAIIYATDPVCRQLYSWLANLQHLHVATWNMHANTEHATQLHGIDVLVSVIVPNDLACMHYICNILYNFVHYESNNIRTYVTDCKCTARGIAIQSHSSINAAQYKYSCSLSILSSTVAT